MSYARLALAAAAALGAPAAVAACLGTLQPGNCSGSIPVHTYAVGDTASDSLTSTTCRHLYQFTTTAQTNLRVTLSSPQLKTFLQLYDQRTAIVVNSALTNMPDTATTLRLMLGAGSYSLAVLPVTTGEAGIFHLETSLDSAAVAGCSPIWVTPGVTTTQTITTGDCTSGPSGASYYTHVYALVLLQTQEVTLTETSTAFPPRILLNGAGSTSSSSPDSTGTRASLTQITIQQGAYTIFAGSTSPAQTGKYTLQIQ